jgi:ATP-dependent DNA helicase RecG
MPIPPAQTPVGAPLSPGSPLQYVKGIGPKRAAQLARKGLGTVGDALWFLPLRHEDRTRFTALAGLRVGQAATASGLVVSVTAPPRGRPGAPGLVTLRDESGFGNLVFFRGAWVTRAFARGQRLVVHGRVGRFRGGPVIQHPEWEVVEAGDDERVHAGRFVPIYSTTEGLGQRPLRSLMWRLVDGFAGEVSEILPEGLRARHRLVGLSGAIRSYHFPPGAEARDLARRRLVFDEFLLLQLGFAILRSRVARARGLVMNPPGELVRRLRASLGWALTGAQERVWDEIRTDMASPSPMHRLLQGDVGSGKTVVAALAALTAVEAGYQAAVMAPTEILAEQHFMTFRGLLAPLGVPVTLLTSSVSARERAERRAALAAGVARCAVGTHALVQEGVEFSRLGLAIVDEQHRFGVEQRARLKALGGEPDVLVMTATPIPRTLALAVHGDLDVSVLDELPPGRTPVTTRARTEARRPQVYDFIRGEVAAGRQAYVVYPLVEESEALDLKAATDMARRLAVEVFPELTVGLLHGRLRYDDKEAIMRRFKAGEIRVLVSTTVIEVGIDVPNASVMLIEHAERFGLAQLHQLRGRVGRGPWRSYCILMTGPRLSAEAQRRIDAMVATTDGFRIARADLEIRGPGDFFGTRQSGLPEFRVADLLRDAAVLEAARREAQAIVARDAELRDAAHRGLRHELLARWRGKLALASVG